jgi:serine/threonine protein kinase
MVMLNHRYITYPGDRYSVLRNCTVLNLQPFARKLVNKHGIDAKIIDNEVKILKELSELGTHAHIVRVLGIGELHSPRYLFIDMELCDLNLAEYVYCTKPREAVPTFFIKDQPPPMRAKQIWMVMSQISKGVDYLHRKGLVHRDLKPANGDTCLMV